MKRYLLIVSLFSFCTCIIIGCGTLGDGFGQSNFPIPKKKLEAAIESLYVKYPEYKIPAKWDIYNDWSSRGYDFLESRIFYFKSSPEEMYYVTFVGDSLALADTANVSIAIRAINKGDSKWYLSNDLDSKERARIEDRFDSAIISRLEEYTGTKVSK